jgi:hypothetical protein
VKKVSSAKGVVSEQFQHQIETPTEFGSLNSVLMSKGMHAINNLPESTLDQTTYSHLISAENDMSNSSDFLFHVHAEKDRDFVVFKDDLALGSEKTRAASAPGSLQAAVPGAALLLGS